MAAKRAQAKASNDNWGGPRPGAGRKPKVSTEIATAARPATGIDLAGMLSSLEQIVGAAGMKQRARSEATNPFRLPAFPPKALPAKNLQMAMDSNLEYASSAWMAGTILNSMAAEGLMFPGYTYLSELAQRPEYRVMSETIADDATRKWITFDVSGTEKETEERQAEDDEDPEGREERRVKRLKDAGLTEKVRDLMEFLDALETREHFYSLIRGDGLFGRMHLYMDFGKDDTLDPAELKTPIGDGRARLSRGKVGKKNPLRRLKAIEPVWTYPMAYNAVNPLLEDWYNPQYWFVMGQELHVSRILPFVSRPVPDILKPAYAFGGISLSQLAEPYVNNWLRTRTSVGDLIHSFSVMVLHTDLNTLVAPQNAASLLARIALFNAMRDNNGTFVVNKATEDFKNVSAPVSGLHQLQAQAQEQMSAVSRIPLVKLTGISPSGLNASSEGEIRVYYDTITSFQNRSVRRPLQIVVNFAMLSLWGEIDADLTLSFEPLMEMSRKEIAELQKAEAERDGIFVDKGAISPEEMRERIINDPELPYAGLDPEDVPDLAEEEEGGLMPEGGGKQPGGGPEGGGQPGGGKEPGGEDETLATAARPRKQ